MQDPAGVAGFLFAGEEKQSLVLLAESSGYAGVTRRLRELSRCSMMAGAVAAAVDCAPLWRRCFNT